MLSKKFSLLFFVLLICNQIHSQDDSEVLRLKDYVNNGQLVYFTKSTPLVDGSEITYVNFCADGTFNLTYDGSMTVKGVQGTSAENYSGS